MKLSIRKSEPFIIHSDLRVIAPCHIVRVAVAIAFAFILNAEIKIERMGGKVAGKRLVRFKIVPRLHIRKAEFCGDHDVVKIFGFRNVREVYIRILVLVKRQSEKFDQFAHPCATGHSVPGLVQNRRFRFRRFFQSRVRHFRKRGRGEQRQRHTERQ